MLSSKRVTDVHILPTGRQGGPLAADHLDVDWLLRSRLGSHLFLIAGSAAVPAAALHALTRGGDAPVSGVGHLVIMAVGSSIAAFACIALAIAGVRGRDGRSLISGGAFGAMTLLLVFHGLATPGVFIGPNGIIALAGGAALPVGGAMLALAALPALRRTDSLRVPAIAVGTFLGLIAAAGIAAFAGPSIVPQLPQAGSRVAVGFLAAGVGFYLVVALRAVRTFTLTRRTSDLLVVVGVTWLGFALVPVLLLQAGSWAWWTGHALELLGVTLVGVPIALDLRRGRPSHPVVGDLPAAELVASQEAFLGPRVRALMVRLERKDRSTEEHTRRVAELAVAIGDELGLAPGRLRELALGGLLHDMGKLAVPDAILGKPGALDDEEFAIIRRHPGDGDELLADLGYSARIRRMVRGHHERLDGSGYPDALRGGELELETRILAVADVYDALVSPRVYRAAWPVERALALLREEAGVAFDTRCVDALERLVGVAGPELRLAA
jgi:HD-GYP domain-containing protein (c-di-GMP phosphodiesterase class II)